MVVSGVCIYASVESCDRNDKAYCIQSVPPGCLDSKLVSASGCFLGKTNCFDPEELQSMIQHVTEVET